MNIHRNILIIAWAVLQIGCRPGLDEMKKNATAIDRMPLIRPDYAGVAIPPNIAPLNFLLDDSCAACVAEITSLNGAPIVVQGKNGEFRLNAKSWKRLLSKNTGNPLRITVYTKDHHGSWHRFRTIENVIAAEPIDRYCTYRLLNFQYNHWRDLRICQRDLSTFSEIPLVNTDNYAQIYSKNDEFKCVNCHTPMNNDPNRFVLQLRSKTFGGETLIADGDSIIKLASRLGHAAWHPGGGIIVFSVYKVQQYFHSVGRQFIDVYDNNSGLVIYDVNGRKVTRVPQLDRQGVLEAWPTWSPDGRYLYFCSAPVPWDDYTKEPPDNFNRTRYSMLRIAYDPVHNRWGDVDTVLSTDETGLSIALPRIAPDNSYCVFCMQEFGAYSFSEVSSDLYIMDLENRTYRKLPVNSEYSESWHSWSSNGRWLLFSSRRGGGIFTRFYICHIDSAGNAGKPFILPQRNPAFYDSFIKCYNVGELAKAPVRFSEQELFNAIRSKKTVSVPLPPNTAVGASGKGSNMWSTVGSRE